MSNGLPKHPEKRHYKRIEEELPVELVVGDEVIQSTTENISCGGMFIPSLPYGLSQDQDLVAIISLPTRSKAVKLSGKICRVSNTDNQHGVAVQFSGLYDENHHEIDCYVKGKLLN